MFRLLILLFMELLTEHPVLIDIQKLAKRKRIKVYLVGGCLRDHIIGRPLSDFDFAVSCGALKLAEALADEIRGAYIVLDEDRGCARVAKKVKGQLWTYDFAEFRAATLEEDLALRDFTINTLTLDLNDIRPGMDLNAAIRDFKSALKDIRAGVIRRVSARSFRDDPLRMMRAFGLQANLGFEIEPRTLEQIAREKDSIRDVSYERIREELFKVLESEKTAAILRSMDKHELLDRVIPQVSVMYNCKQGGYHHLDVWEHSLEVVHQLDLILSDETDPEIVKYLDAVIGGGHSRRSLMKLAALFHDIGKPDTRQKKGERLSFHGHENVGRYIVKGISKMLRISTRERHLLEDMVQMHLRPGYLSNYKTPSERMVYRYFRDAGDEVISILLLSLADQRSTRGPLTTEADQAHHETICRQLIERYLEQKRQKPYVPLVNGRDIMKALKTEGSPLIGQILDEIQEQHVLGKIKSKAQALELARKMAGA